jgi:hypothetical protein
VIWALIHFVLIGCFLLQFVTLTGLAFTWAAAKAVGRRMFSRSFRWGSTEYYAGAAYLCSVVVIGYTMVLSCAVGVGDPRYRVPVDEFVIFATILGFRAWWQAIDELSVTAPAARGYAQELLETSDGSRIAG